MHRLSEGFNKLITEKINEQAYQTRERALKYKDDLERRDSYIKEQEQQNKIEEKQQRTHKRNSSMGSSLVEDDSDKFSLSNNNANANDPLSDNAKATKKYL